MAKKYEATMERLKNIPRERLCFYFGNLRKKDGYESHVVNGMPFDLDEIDDGDKRWDQLKDLAVAYLRDDLKELPSYAKEQDYERYGGSGYQGLTTMQSWYDTLQSQESGAITIDKTFDNAFDKIILPDGFREKIIETVTQLKEKKKIFDDWGLGEKIRKGKGVNLLFSGQSGTGKTYAGEIIAEYLGFEADVVSVATLESKWVGESEKNVSNIFKSLGGSKKVLILDEADSFLSARGGHDVVHQAKLTNQFLIELERHEGVVVMTTNRPVALDKALSRRIDLVLDFPAPGPKAREAIWRYMIPEKMPTDKIDFEELAKVELNGGEIKNAVLAAARRTITQDKKNVEHAMLLAAAQEEHAERKVLHEGKDHSGGRRSA